MYDIPTEQFLKQVYILSLNELENIENKNYIDKEKSKNKVFSAFEQLTFNCKSDELSSYYLTIMKDISLSNFDKVKELISHLKN